MDKQKQIEEMATIMCGRNIDCEKCECRKGFCYYLSGANKLSKYYQPKIPEGSVVLTRAHEDKIFNDYVKYIKKVRKETAKKFAERLKETLSQYYENLTRGFVFKYIDEIAKEITEG